jgi:hypothetical protein
MEDEIDGYVAIGHADGAQDLLGVVDVDIADERKSQQPHGLLPMNHHDHARATFALEFQHPALACGLESSLLQERLERGEHEEEPEYLP